MQRRVATTQPIPHELFTCGAKHASGIHKSQDQVYEQKEQEVKLQTIPTNPMQAQCTIEVLSHLFLLGRTVRHVC